MNIRARIDRVSQDAKAAASRPKDPARSNSRKGDRHRLVGEKALVSRGGSTLEVELINVSGGGAMVAGAIGADPSAFVRLHLGENGTIECAVCWERDGRAGLEFAHETQIDCSAEEQAVLLREVIARTYGAAHFHQPAPPTRSDGAADDETHRAKRHPLIWSGTLNCCGRRTPIRVRNISSTGAMVQCASGARLGSDAVLDLGKGLTAHATVGWAVGDQVGLRFTDPFDVTQLSRSTPEVAPATWVQPDYLKSGASTTPWDAKWQRLSMREINDELEGFMKR